MRISDWSSDVCSSDLTVTEEIAESLGLKEASGAFVAGVVKGSPAEEAGFKTGDIILRFDGQEVPESRRLPRMVAETAVGKDAHVVIWRNGEKKELTVKLGELEKRSEEHTSELQSLMRISYAVFCLKKKK